MDAHNEILEQLAAYVAGGLEPPERAAVEAHVATCAECAAALKEIRRLDADMQGLFAEIRPEAGLEDRVVQELRGQRRTWRMVHPAVRRAVSGLAAALVLGAVGYGASDLIEHNRLPLAARMEEGRVASNPAAVVRRGAFFDMFDKNGAAPTGVYQSASTTTPALPGLSEPQSGETQLGRKLVEDESLRQKASEPELKGPSAGWYGWARQDGAAPGQRGALASNFGGYGGGGGFGGAGGRAGLGGVAQGASGFASDVDLYSGDVALKWGDVSGKPANGTAGRTDGGALTVNNGTVALADGIHAVTGPTAGTILGVGSGVLAYGKRSSGEGVIAGKPAAAESLAAAYYFKPSEVEGTLGQKVVTEQNRDVVAGVKLQALQAGDVKLGEVAEKARQLPELKHQVAAHVVASPEPADKPAATPAGAPEAAPKPPEPQVEAVIQRKIIRNGEVEFEVDSFDSSYVQVSKIVTEEGGFVSSTSSDKLANGKVQGTIVVRVPPDRLDTLVLKLRALGDLKSQKISAQDVTKVYYDLDSELRASRAMEERLLNIIKTGKGEIKDLIEAEKQLGIYREKIEKVEGEIRYYNNLVSLSTLSITLVERDIKHAAYVSQTEQVSMGLETEDVEKTRTDAIKAIDEAKGRVIESNLKKFDAGQLAATIVCEVAPEAAGPLTDRLKQLGRVARLDMDRKTTSAEGTGAPVTGRIEKKDTRFSISIYNLANIAPRQTTTMSLAVSSVEEAYNAIIETVKAHNGRVVTSNLNRLKPEQTTGSITFEVPSADADATSQEIRRQRDVMSLSVTENPDTNNVTTAKRGFNLQIVALATVPPRESEQEVIASKGKVAETYRALLEELKKADARIIISQLNEQDPANVSGQLDFEVLRTAEQDVRTAIGSQTYLISRSTQRSSDAENTVDSKIRLSIRLMSLDRIAPRETFSLGIASTKEVPATYQELLTAIQDAGCRVITSQLNEQDRQNVTASLDFEVPREKRDAVEKALKAAGVTHSRTLTKATDTQNTVDLKVRMQVSLIAADQLPPREMERVALTTGDVEKVGNEIVAAAQSAGGRVVEPPQVRTSDSATSSHLTVDVPLAKAGELRNKIRGLGEVESSESAKNPQTPDGEIARARFDISLATPDATRGLGAAVRNGWAVSIRGLLWSLQLIVIGLLFVAPWALVLWGGWKWMKRKKPATAA